MEKNSACKEKCEFKVHPCNFKVQIREIKPFCISRCKPLVLDLKIITKRDIKNCITIKSKPCHGKLFKLDPSTIIYKPNRKFCGLDLFQIMIEDECGGICIETVLIRVL